jgi:hypothetical protein
MGTNGREVELAAMRASLPLLGALVDDLDLSVQHILAELQRKLPKPKPLLGLVSGARATRLLLLFAYGILWRVLLASGGLAHTCMRTPGTLVFLMSLPSGPRTQYLSDTQCCLAVCG